MSITLRFCVLASLFCSLLVTLGCSGKNNNDERYWHSHDSLEETRAADKIEKFPIYFEYDKYDLSAESQEILAEKARLLKRLTTIRVSIQGHTDERGTEEYNLALGERRARAAYEFLIMSGVSAKQLEIVSYGKLVPAVQGVVTSS